MNGVRVTCEYKCGGFDDEFRLDEFEISHLRLSQLLKGFSPTCSNGYVERIRLNGPKSITTGN